MDDPRIPLLPFEKALMIDTFSDDCLFIFAKGLDMERLFLSHLYFHNDPISTVLVINTEQDDEHYFFDRLKEFNSKCFPKLLTAEVLTKERILLYNTGGIQFVTSRILMVDLLSDRVPIDKVTGILVYRAHRVLNSFQESFILRLFREKRSDGFVKAFTDDAAQITRGGIGQLQRLLNRLYVRRVVLLPRFDSAVKECFENCKPKFTQVAIDLSPREKKIRSCLAEIISTCFRDLKQCSQGMLHSNSDLASLDSNLSAAAALKELNLENDLRNKALLLSERQERLLTDLRILRILLHKIEDLDLATAWHFICRIRSDKDILEKNSGWIFTSTASIIFNTVEQLCFANTEDGETAVTIPPKWNGFISILEDLRRRNSFNDKKDESILVLAANENTCYQLVDLAKLGREFFTWRLTESVLSTSKRPRGYAISFTRKQPPSSPLWNPDEVMFYDEQFMEKDRNALVNDIREAQKKVSKEARKRTTKKIIDPKACVDHNQPKLVNFGIIRYSEKKQERREKRRANKIDEKKKDVHEVRAKRIIVSPSKEFVPDGMLPEDPLTDFYVQSTSATITKTPVDSSTNGEIKENSDDDVQFLTQIKTRSEKIVPPIFTSKKIKTEVPDGRDMDSGGSLTSPPLTKAGKLIFIALGNRYNLLNCLETYRPAHIILYNVDVLSSRIIETFQAYNSNNPIELYSLMYTDTTEEERYLVALQREQLAFEMLIREQGVLMTPTEYDVARDSVSQLTRSTLLQKDSRLNRRVTDDADIRKLVIVDMREFNSELPTILYRRGVDISATTLEIGDYVLAPQICVERKALDDLVQSLNGGRIFKQSEQMLRYYNKSILLIESSEKFRQCKVNGGPFQGELSRRGRETRMLLTMLIRACPRLALMWSFSPAQSAEFFEELTLDQPNPSVEAAIAIHSGEVNADDLDVYNNDEDVDFAASADSASIDNANAGDNNAVQSRRVALKKRAATRINAVLRRSLLHFPGLLAGDVDRLMKGNAITSKHRVANNEKADNKEEEEETEEGEDAPENLAQLVETSARMIGNILQNQTRARELVDWIYTDFRLVPMP